MTATSSFALSASRTRMALQPWSRGGFTPDARARYGSAMADIGELWLQDFLPFAALKDVAHRFKVQIAVFGGAASRAAMYRACDRHDIDIFDLAPFSSDIDLVHTGDAKLTSAIAADIADRVPFSTWCRWAILDDKAARRALANRNASTQVPLRRIGFGTGGPSKLPPQAQVDLSEGRSLGSAIRHLLTLSLPVRIAMSRFLDCCWHSMRSQTCGRSPAEESCASRPRRALGLRARTPNVNSCGPLKLRRCARDYGTCLLRCWPAAQKTHPI